ncbi:hypothetical protein NHX12_020491 [Muraenolepis orangiensis]|uniref:Uncharacterized protein n=1 Tax=Muraenolepis orangiensis TaxID=630683 RepID=A0A9Q0EUZ8_9TELE|nr:hypothetical protein NHX12_020491 [Muraenolepis orangiensis]
MRRLRCSEGEEDQTKTKGQRFKVQQEAAGNRMQNPSQERSLARASGRFHPSTNGKEEEMPPALCHFLFGDTPSTPDGDSAAVDEEEAEFNWEEYMEKSGTSAAPHNSFKHGLAASRYDSL